MRNQTLLKQKKVEITIVKTNNYLKLINCLKVLNFSSFILILVIFSISCSSSKSPKWIEGRWELESYGEESSHVFADALSQRFYWVIENDKIKGYMKKGWDGTLVSLFYNNAESISDEFELKSELKFRIISQSEDECLIELYEGVELYPITSMVSIRSIKKVEKVYLRLIGNEKISIDREVDVNDHSVQNQAALSLMKDSNSLITIGNITYHRIVLDRPFL